MGREGGGRSREEAEKVQGRHRGAGEGAGVADPAVGVRHHPQVAGRAAAGQCCQMANFDPFLSLDCVRVEGVGGAIQGKEGIQFCSVG